MQNNNNHSKEKIAVFGAGGFIGSHMIEALTQTDYEVLAIDVNLEKLDEVLPDKANVTTIELDITKDREEVETIIKDSDVIIDLIAYANPSIYITDPIGTVTLDLFENLWITELCVKHKKFLFQYSTCEVYGLDNGRNQPFNEDESLLVVGPINEHRWIYSCAKQMLERIVHAYGIKEDLDYIIIRPFNFVGPRIDYLVDDKDEEGNPRVFSHFMSALLLNKPLPLVDGGINLRSYTHIEDATDAFMRILENRQKFNREIINIGTPKNEISIRGLAELMIELYKEETGADFNAGTIDIPSEEFYGEGYADCDRRIPDNSKIVSLGWEEKYDLEAIFRDSIRYYIKNNEFVTQ